MLDISARNQLSGKITSITIDGVTAEVTVDIGDGKSVTAVITKGSVERLGLSEGSERDRGDQGYRRTSRHDNHRRHFMKASPSPARGLVAILFALVLLCAVPFQVGATHATPEADATSAALSQLRRLSCLPMMRLRHHRLSGL